MPYADNTETPLTDQELIAMRSRWTARNANPGQDWQSLYDQFHAAQNDLGRVLRQLKAFEGPPISR